MSTATAEFTPGQEVIWTGTRHLFERRVTITAARSSYLAIFGETPADAVTVYDIHDPEVIKGTVFGIPPEQLHVEVPR